MQNAINRLASAISDRQQLLTGTPYTDTTLLNQVRAPGSMGVYASVGQKYHHAIFGRDSIELAEDIYKYDQTLAHDIIVLMARLQGTRYDRQSEEEPGKIHHEYRTTTFANEPIPEHSLGIMRKLQEMWGNPGHDRLLYYGTYDATPLYMRLVQLYTAEYGNGLLGEKYADKDGIEHTIRHSVRMAAEWLVRNLEQREDRMLGYRRSNPRGIENQVWKDSVSAYLFIDGSFPDHTKQIVSAELQGYAYDALLFAAQLFANKADVYRQLAAQLQHSTIEKLWMPDAQFFAQGLGTHKSGEERQIDTRTSNGALLLDSRLLEDLPERARSMYVGGTERAIISPDFMTQVGVRCRALRHANLLPFADYHGSYAVWAKETSDIARGLLRFGRVKSAARLHKAILYSFQLAEGFYELYYVDADNVLFHDYEKAASRLPSHASGEQLPKPEPGQAWSISAAIASSHALNDSLAKKFPVQYTLQQALVLPRMQPRKRIKLRAPALNQIVASAQASLKRRPRIK